MGWPSGHTPGAAFEKMVLRRRGGWCFEMKSLFSAVLRGLGFKVTRLCGGVNREVLGDRAIGDHLAPRVDLDRPDLAAVGMADAIIAPVPPALGPIQQRGFDFATSVTDDGWLRFSNYPQDILRSFDLHLDHSDRATTVAANAQLMCVPGSPFTGALAVIRHTRDGCVARRNDRLHRVTAARVVEGRVTGRAHLAEIPATLFDLEVPDLEEVWERLQPVLSAEAAC